MSGADELTDGRLVAKCCVKMHVQSALGGKTRAGCVAASILGKQGSVHERHAERDDQVCPGLRTERQDTESTASTEQDNCNEMPPRAEVVGCVTKFTEVERLATSEDANLRAPAAMMGETDPLCLRLPTGHEAAEQVK